MINHQKISEFIADAYREAALADHRNMLLIVDLFESIRRNLDISNPYTAWEYITLDKEKFDNDYSIPKILQLKTKYFNYLYETILLENDKIFENNKNEALAKWKRRFTEATIYFKVDLMGMLCLQREKWGMIDAEATQLYKYAIEDNWVDSYNLINEFPNILKSDRNLLAATECILLEIIMFQFPKNSQGQNLFLNQANIHLTNAKKLQPDHLLTKRAEAEYLMNNGEIQKAKELFFQLTSENALDYVSYLFIGDCFINELEKLDENHPDKNHYLEKAEYWYNEAIRKNFIQPDGYSRLVRLYANKNYIKTKNDKFESLLQKIELYENYYDNNYLVSKKLADNACFEGTWQYNSYLDIAFGWQAIEEYSKAKEYFEKAIDTKKNNQTAYLAQADLLGLQNLKNENLAVLTKLYEIDPKNYQTNWQLAEYFSKENDLKKAENYYTNCIEIRPSWNAYLFSFIGFMYFNNVDYKKAAQFYRKAYQNDASQNDFVAGLADSLVEMATTATTLNKMMAAENLYKEAVEIEKSSDKWNSLGVFYYENDRNVEAIAAYENAVKVDQTDPIIIRNLADAYLKAGTTEKLIDLISKNSDINDPLIYEKIGLANEQKAKDEKHETKKKELNDQAEENYKKAIDLDSKTSRYYNRLGIFYYNLEKYMESVEYYKKALEIEPQNITILNNLCLSLESIKLTSELEIYYNIIINIEPKSPAIFNKIGILYFNETNFEKALEYFEQALHLEPTNWIYQSNIGDALKYLNRKDEAILAYIQANNLNKKDYFNWNELGVMYLDTIQNKKAADCFQKAIKLNNEELVLKTNLALAFNGIALEFGNQSNYDEALIYYKKALKLDHKNWIYQANIADSLKKINKSEEAIQAYKKAIKLKDDDYFNWNELGNLYLDIQQNLNAVDCFQKAISLNHEVSGLKTNLAFAFNNVGMEYFSEKDYDTAKEYFLKASELDDINFLYFDNVGTANKLLGNFEEAIAAYKKVLTLKENEYTTSNSLGILYIEYNQQFERAIECLEKAINLEKTLNLKTDFPSIYKNLSIAYNAVGNSHYKNFEDEKAMEFYKKAIDAFDGDVAYYKNLILVLKNLGKITEGEDVLAKKVMSNDSLDNKSKQDIKNYFATLMES